MIQINDVSKSFEGELAVRDIQLHVNNGEFLTLLGPSGCGKTTLLRLLAGFETPDTGQIILNGEDVTTTPPEQRHLNMVFQNYALFPHLSVYDNIAFGLRCQKIKLGNRVEEALEMVHLEKHAHKKPDKLSGGQQQRVALARAIINRPLVLLLDEPFSALDYGLRKKMRLELKQLQRDLGITFIFVTHDQEDALTLSDRIVILNEGIIQQVDTARIVYEEPENLFTAQFIGEANIFETTVIETHEKMMSVDIEHKRFELKNRKHHKKGDKICVIIRPEDIEAWSRQEIKSPDDYIPGVVEQVIYKGSTVDLVIKLESGMKMSATEFFDEDDPNLIYKTGEKVFCEWKLGWEVTLPHEI